MEKDKLIQLLKDTYNSGYEDGLVKGVNGVECNNFDDVIYENISTINELCNSHINLNKVQIHTIKDETTGALRDVRVEYTKDGLKVGPYYGALNLDIPKDDAEIENKKNDKS